jgi:hypothetical protein
VVDAINCFSDCCEGNRRAVEEMWLLADDQTLTGGTFRHIARRLQAEVAEALRKEDASLIAADIELQDMLHRHKMWMKYGGKGEVE